MVLVWLLRYRNHSKSYVEFYVFLACVVLNGLPLINRLSMLHDSFPRAHPPVRLLSPVQSCVEEKLSRGGLEGSLLLLESTKVTLEKFNNTLEEAFILS
jgi:hypothetical protein